MKDLIYLFVMSVFLLPMQLQAASYDVWLDKLDASLDKRNYYDKQKQERIARLKDEMERAKKEGRQFEQLYRLYDEYKSYCFDSANHYAYECLHVAELGHNEEHLLKAKFAIAFSLISAGIFNAAQEVLGSIDRSKLRGELLTEYYERYVLLWRSMADFIGSEPYYTTYITRSNAYLDSLIHITPEHTIQLLSYKESLLMRKKEYQAVMENYNELLEMSKDSMDLHLRAMTAAEMAWANLFLDNEEKAIEYFAQSAIADNESATREITALYHLARLIYKRGDYERASRYVHQALEDVNFYNTRLRKLEINGILPIIEQDRYDMMRSQRNWFIAASVLFVILVLVILKTYHSVHKRNLKLTEARNTIAGQLEQLKEANERLEEADKIKNAYIGRSFSTNADYIAKVEKILISIERKIATRQYDDLRNMMQLSKVNAEREDMYASFDMTFLKLFPNFVDRYNELFEEKDRKTPPEHSLTSEMRIFALIRLGVTDPERIATFLNYSVHTVNTYKTRIKNRSIVDNDQFEQLIMEI